MRVSEARKQECREHLWDLLKPGDTVWTTLVHVSRSGMYRVIDLYVIKNNEPWRISGWASDLLEGYDSRHEGCRASGCGMDMGFHLVHNLGYALWPNGFDCVGQGCPSNDHHNLRDEDVPKHHTSGGYALKQRWL